MKNLFIEEVRKTRMHHIIIPPAPAIAHLVKCFWSFDIDLPAGSQLHVSTFVNDSTGITFVLDEGNSILRSTIDGHSTQPRSFAPRPSVHAFGAQFYPGCLPVLFGYDANAFTDQDLMLDDLYNCELQEVLMEAGFLHKRIQILTDFILSIDKNRSRRDATVAACLDNIWSSLRIPTVNELTKSFRVSERQLERKFLSSIGVSPRHFLKVARFQHSLEHLKSNPDIHYSDLCHDMGYYDQAHLIKDIRRFSGQTPRALHRKLMTLPVNQRGNTN